MKKLSEQPKVVLAITSYHVDEEMANLTRKCLESLGDERPDEVMVIDDGSPHLVRFEGFKQIFRNENGGFPKCANTGFQEAYKAGADIIILSNNDVEFTEGWLEAILKPIKQGYDISMIRISDSDGTDTRDEITEDDYFGSLFAMKREVYEKLGGYDKSFEKGSFEDKDYYVRAKRAGFRIGKNHAAFVYHQGRATMDKLYPNQEDFHENMERFKSKYGGIL